MITATCKNDACQWHNIGRNVLGPPTVIVCGECRQACDITDERDDPPMPDTDDAPVGV